MGRSRVLLVISTALFTGFPAAAHAQTVGTRCDGGACALEVRGGFAILHVMPSVYRDGERIGRMRPREEFETMFSVDLSAADAYQEFENREMWHRWMHRFWMVGFMASGLGFQFDATWANEILYASMVLYGGAFVPGNMAKSAFREATDRYNAALDRGPGS